MGLLMGMFVPHVSHQFPTGCEVCLTILAPVWFGSRVSVDMVLKAGQGLEPSLTD